MIIIAAVAAQPCKIGPCLFVFRHIGGDVAVFPQPVMDLNGRLHRRFPIGVDHAVLIEAAGKSEGHGTGPGGVGALHLVVALFRVAPHGVQKGSQDIFGHSACQRSLFIAEDHAAFSSGEHVPEVIINGLGIVSSRCRMESPCTGDQIGKGRTGLTVRSRDIPVQCDPQVAVHQPGDHGRYFPAGDGRLRLEPVPSVPLRMPQRYRERISCW